MRFFFGLTATCSLAVFTALAQGPDFRREFAVRGQILSPVPIVGELTVELVTPGERPERAQVDPDGSFKVPGAHTGSYELRVVGPSGAIIHEELVTVDGGQFLSVHIPNPPAATDAGPGTISLRELTHKIPPQAQKAFAKGRQAAAKGKSSEAVECFVRAVTIDPEFVEGFNELGAAEATSGHLAAAADNFQRALELVPEHPRALFNLTVVLAKQNRFHEAGAVARRALKVDPNSGAVRYILATSLVIENGDKNEAIENFERSADQVPKAHLAAAELLVEDGRRQDAIRHLEQYLRSLPAGTTDRAKVEARLEELRR
jgi:Flp pilus assembly protein TadD